MEARRPRSSTTVESPASWGGSLFKKQGPSSSSSTPPHLTLASRTGSFSGVPTPSRSPASDPQHRRAPSLASSLDAPPTPPMSSSFKSFLSPPSKQAAIPEGSASSPRLSLPPSAFAKSNSLAPKSATTKTKEFALSVVGFLRSPRGASPKVVTSAAPNPYANANTNMDTAIFGVEFEVAVRRSNHIHELLPDVIYKCFIYLKDKAAEEEGIFRLTGSVADIKKIRDAYDSGSDYDLSTCLNPHTVAGTLKLFIREMPQRLIPGTWAWSESRPLQELHDFMKQLSPPHRCFLSCLIKLLCVINRNSDVTKMGVANLVIVFSAALQCTGSFLTHLINHATELFPVDELYQTRERMAIEKKEKEDLEKAQREKEEQEARERELAAQQEEAARTASESTKIDEEEAKRYNEMLHEKADESSGEAKDKENGHHTIKKKKNREHGHHKKSKRKTEKEEAHKDHHKTKKKEKKERKERKGHSGDEEEDRSANGRVPLFNEDKGEEKDNVWVEHMEKYEKGETRKSTKETKEIAHTHPAAKDRDKDHERDHERQEVDKEKEREKETWEHCKVSNRERRTSTITIELKKDRTRTEHEEEDIFKEKDEKEREAWELDEDEEARENERKKEKKVKKRLQTIFDSDDE